MRRILDFFTLFTSVSTLLCCALPALLVAVGLGAAMAGFLANHPELIWISENKGILFIMSGLMLLANGVIMYKNRNAPCLTPACARTRQTSKWIYIISLGVYGIGASFAYVLPYII